MNEIHKAVLKKHGPDIVKSLIVNDSLLGALFYRGVFKEEMMDMIRVCLIPNEKIYKLLELLPKCGPDAFDGFVDTLEENYDWLAKLLKESVASETDNMLAQQVQIHEVQTPRATSSNIKLDSDIKTRVSSFVQKQFGSVRKISMSEKKQIERWIGEWLQNERKRLTVIFEQTASDVFENPQIKGKLWTVYKQVCDKMKRPVKKKQDFVSSLKDSQINDNSSHHNTDVTMETENLIDLDADDITFSLLEKELNEIIDRVLYLEKQVNKSFQYMEFLKTHDKEISVVVNDLCGEYRLKERELVEEKKKNERMLIELYEYSTSTNRMQFHMNNQDHQIRTLEEQISDMASDNVSLREEIKVLERQALIHLEKEQTLIELRQTKEELQSMLNNEKKRNEELSKSVKDYKAPLSRLYQNKKNAILNNSNTGNKTVQPPKVALKRNPPKRSHTVTRHK